MKALYVNNLNELSGYLKHFKINKKKPIRRRGVKLSLIRPTIKAANANTEQKHPKSGFFSSLYADLKWLLKRHSK